jgi:hypothetical protein
MTLMLSVEGWFNGLTAVGIFVIGWILGIFFIYQSRKTKAKLLKYLGLSYIFIVNSYWGICMDFIAILFTDTIPYPTYPTPPNFVNIRLFLTFLWGGFAPFTLTCIGTELIIPKKKWYVLPIVLLFSIAYEFFIFFDTDGSFVNSYPIIPGEDLWLASLVIGSPASIIIFILTTGHLFFSEIGFIIKAHQSKGIIRKKFLFLFFGYFFAVFFVMMEGFFSEITLLIFTRVGFMISFWIMYLGLKEEPDKPQESIKKEVRVEEGLMRLIKRPDTITEEEVTFHKEKKICLVCKGKLSRSLYLCPKCDALYCNSCAETLVNLENVCWVCDEPIDETKPSRVSELNDDDSIRIHKNDLVTTKKHKRFEF